MTYGDEVARGGRLYRLPLLHLRHHPDLRGGRATFISCVPTRTHVLKGIPWTTLTLFLGWLGILRGGRSIASIVMYHNLRGGVDRDAAGATRRSNHREPLRAAKPFRSPNDASPVKPVMATV